MTARDVGNILGLKEVHCSPGATMAAFDSEIVSFSRADQYHSSARDGSKDSSAIQEACRSSIIEVPAASCTTVPLRHEPDSCAQFNTQPSLEASTNASKMSLATPDMLNLLYEQHRMYTYELGRTHQKLSKLYKKLSKAERVLSEREQRQLTRDERKKWQYSRVHTKRNVTDLESEQANLHDALRQCNDLIASLEHGPYSSPMTSWASQLPPSPFLFSPFSPAACSAYAFGSHRPSRGGQPVSQTQYWDLSSLPERRQSRQSSPYGTRSADSGFEEPSMPARGIDTPVSAYGHVYAHEAMTPTFTFTFNSQAPDSSAMAKSSEVGEVADLKQPISPAKLGANVEDSSKYSHKRCVSENAIELDLGKLAPPPTKRGISVGPASARSHS